MRGTRCARSCSIRRPPPRPVLGHRVVEIGCIELVNRITDRRDLPGYLNRAGHAAEAEAVHGLSIEFLSDKPLSRTWSRRLTFIADSTALFTTRVRSRVSQRRARTPGAGACRERAVDTLTLARRRHPGGPNRLDDLCARYGIDNSRRTRTARCWTPNCSRRSMPSLAAAARPSSAQRGGRDRSPRAFRGRAPASGAAHRAAHRSRARRAHAFAAGLGPAAIWREYLTDEEAGPAGKK